MAKMNYLSLPVYALLICLLISGHLGAQQTRDSILLDFGSTPSATPRWNNISDATSSTVAALYNARGLATGHSLEITDAFNNINNNGTTAPGPALGLPPSATGDSFYGNSATFGGKVEPTAAVSFGGLDPAESYTFTIFASRIASGGEIRDTRYTLTGAGSVTDVLDAAENTSQTVTLTVLPAADGTIVLAAEPGPGNTNVYGFFYLGALVIDYAYEEIAPPPPPTPTDSGIDTILVDFGGNTESGLRWNNVTNPKAGTVPNLTNSYGYQSGYGLAITDAFNGINQTGTQDPDPALGFGAAATGDSFFGNTTTFEGGIEPTAAVELSGLTTGKDYQLDFYASRLGVGDNRETQYVVAGATTDTVYLNPAGNVNELATTTVQPDAGGKILVTVSPGPANVNGNGFYYLGALRMSYLADEAVNEPTLTLTAPNGGEFYQVGKVVDLTWEATNTGTLILEYSTDNGTVWTTIASVGGTAGQFAWTVPDTPTDVGLVRVRNESVEDQSDWPFTISADRDTFRIVVLGSSTAAGTGTSTPDSAWVNRYAKYLSYDTRFEVINLGRGGYTTYHILPTGSTTGAGVGVDPDPARNLTQALSLRPSAIIINMPSNDAERGFPVGDQLANFATVMRAATDAGVASWVATYPAAKFQRPR